MNKVSAAPLAARIKFQMMLACRRLKPGATSEIFKRDSSSGDDFISAVYVINLDRQMARWQRFKKETNFVKLCEGQSLIDMTRRVSAIDARSFDPHAAITSAINSKYRLSEQYFVEPDERLKTIIERHDGEVEMTVQEVAVAQSHIGVWRKIIEDNCFYALILEDDIYFDVAFAALTNE